MAGELGFGELTVAGIAEHVGLTKGNIHHYFDSKEELIEHAVRFAHAQFRKAVLERLRNAGSPSERLWSVIDGSFAPELFELKYRRLWVSIFDVAKTNSRLKRLLEILDRRTNMLVMASLRHLVPPSRVEITGFGIMALMDGCWLLAVWEPEVTRRSALQMIAEHIQASIPNFDMSVVNISE
jgi:TetR/AcrR family transcriptional regulator, transcriptional repressor of bet genes